MFSLKAFQICRRFISILLVVSLAISPTAGYAQSAFVSMLPEPGKMLGVSVPFTPVLVKGLVIHPDKPLNFDFVVDSGHDATDQAVVREQSQRMAQYFLAAITVPEDQLWVNLSPYEKDRVIENDLGQTVLGRDMLAQDYMLKQLSASLIYPEKGLGKEFWANIYREAQAKFGTTDIPVDTFNKVWIMPDKAEVFEKGNAVYVTQARLKVMLDSDYAAADHADTSEVAKPPMKWLQTAPAKWPTAGQAAGTGTSQELAKNLIRAIILPAIEKEVNEGRNFATIRQVYHAAILAKWYRSMIQNTLLAQAYMGKNMVAGVESDEKALKEQIYQRYIAAYKKGVFDYIKEEQDPRTQNVVPHKYFSGGISDFAMQHVAITRADNASAIVPAVGNVFQVNLSLAKGNDFAMSIQGQVAVWVAAVAIGAAVLMPAWPIKEIPLNALQAIGLSKGALDVTGSSKMRDRGFEFGLVGLRLTSVPQRNDFYAEFEIRNVTRGELPFLAAVGVAYDDKGKARYLSTVNFSEVGGGLNLTMKHYPLATAQPPEAETGIAVGVPSGKTVRLAVSVGEYPGEIVQVKWAVKRPGEETSFFVVNNIADLFHKDKSRLNVDKAMDQVRQETVSIGRENNLGELRSSRFVSLLGPEWSSSLNRRAFLGIATLAVVGVIGFCAGCSDRKSSSDHIDIEGAYLPERYALPRHWEKDGDFYLGDVDKVFVDRDLRIEVIGATFDSGFGGMGSSTSYKFAYRLTNIGKKPIMLTGSQAQFHDGDTLTDGTATTFMPDGKTAGAEVLKPGEVLDAEPWSNLPTYKAPAQIFITILRENESESRFSFIGLERLRDGEHVKKYYKEKYGIDIDKGVKEKPGSQVDAAMSNQFKTLLVLGIGMAGLLFFAKKYEKDILSAFPVFNKPAQERVLSSESSGITEVFAKTDVKAPVVDRGLKVEVLGIKPNIHSETGRVTFYEAEIGIRSVNNQKIPLHGMIARAYDQDGQAQSGVHGGYFRGDDGVPAFVSLFSYVDKGGVNMKDFSVGLPVMISTDKPITIMVPLLTFGKPIDKISFQVLRPGIGQTVVEYVNVQSLFKGVTQPETPKESYRHDVGSLKLYQLQGWDLKESRKGYYFETLDHMGLTLRPDRANPESDVSGGIGMVHLDAEFVFWLHNRSNHPMRIKKVEAYAFGDKPKVLNGISIVPPEGKGFIELAANSGGSVVLPIRLEQGQKEIPDQLSVFVQREGAPDVVYTVVGLKEMMSKRWRNEKDNAELGQQASLDKAMNGGIDIQNIDVTYKAGSVKVQFDDQAVRDVLKDGFNGFTPVIMNIAPVKDVLMALGVAGR